ncbi:MAG: DUF4325 domain-containing protein [Actinomycetota bacterium]|nr:DUF4325 domain-containing protein [Actinomycetota bacterium]
MANRKGERTEGGIKNLARQMLSRQEALTSGQLAQAAGVTRQAAHYHLVQMLESGEVDRRGSGRGTRYIRNAEFARGYELVGLEEDRVWKEVAAAVHALDRLRPNVRSILEYSFTEMLNNAIDHSAGRLVQVTLWTPPAYVAFEIVDDGIGALRNVRESWRLPDDFAAIQELSKGKGTTAPTRHSGEGIFFTSKAVDRFELEAGTLRWIVANRRQDQVVRDVPPRRGTLVRCEVDTDSKGTLTDVFSAFTERDTLEFDKSSLRVSLFETGGDFVSRSEAKRLANRLEGFTNVILDFAGVQGVGQGFVDELFRVWARAHPETRLVPVNMSPAVAWMVGRGSASTLLGPDALRI